MAISLIGGRGGGGGKRKVYFWRKSMDCSSSRRIWPERITSLGESEWSLFGGCGVATKRRSSSMNSKISEVENFNREIKNQSAGHTPHRRISRRKALQKSMAVWSDVFEVLRGGVRIDN